MATMAGETPAVAGNYYQHDMSSPFEQVIISESGEVVDDVELSLLETLDHVLNRGLVIAGEITISVANIDLIFLGLNVLLSSVETANEVIRHRESNKANS
jgi:hypothetical protein